MRERGSRSAKPMQASRVRRHRRLQDRKGRSRAKRACSRQSMGRAPLPRHREGGDVIDRNVMLHPSGRVCAGSSASAMRSTSASPLLRSESACTTNKPSAVGATIVRTTLVGAGSCIARSWCGRGREQRRAAGDAGREESSRVC